MKDVFLFIDSWDSKFNILRDFRYLRKVALVFALSMIPIWFVLGWDSGVGMIEEGIKALVIGENVIEAAYSVYGTTFHFSAFVIYGLLFVGMSIHFESLGLKGSKNSLYSAFLVILNISIFELWYFGCIAHFQMRRSLIEWILTDILYLQQYFLFFTLGAFTVLAIWIDSFRLNEKQVVGRNYHFILNRNTAIVVVLCLASILLWIYFPFPIETTVIGDWTNGKLFPQTHYSYMKSVVYVRNDLLHLVNLATKSMFAFTQFYILSRLKPSMEDSHS